VREPGRNADDSIEPARVPLASLTGVVETVLAGALVLAAQAQQWDMVADLARELAARRQEPPASGSVAALAPALETSLAASGERPAGRRS
jgi:cytochrome c-type biogenesis protein CcmH/NrfG